MRLPRDAVLSVFEYFANFVLHVFSQKFLIVRYLLFLKTLPIPY